MHGEVWKISNTGDWTGFLGRDVHSAPLREVRTELQSSKPRSKGFCISSLCSMYILRCVHGQLLSFSRIILSYGPRGALGVFMDIELFEYRNSRQGLLYSNHYTDFLERKTETSHPSITILLLWIFPSVLFRFPHSFLLLPRGNAGFQMSPKRGGEWPSGNG